MNAPFYVELVWNREFNFVPHGPAHLDLDTAIKYAQGMENYGDGASVKKTQVIDADGTVVWAYGKKIELKETT